MKLIIINGSPRGKESNSNVIANWIATGVVKSIQLNKLYTDQKESVDSTETIETTQVDKFYTANVNSHRATVDAIEDDSTVVVVFPLYVDAMPAITKLFFEELEIIANKKKNVKIYFVIHSGFEGAKHCRVLEEYLVYLSKYLGFKYMGTAIKPGSEGIRLSPIQYILDVKIDFKELSKDIANSAEFSTKTLKSLAGFELPPEEYKTGIKESKGNTGYFSDLLKKNNALDKCFDKPYLKEE